MIPVYFWAICILLTDIYIQYINRYRAIVILHFRADTCHEEIFLALLQSVYCICWNVAVINLPCIMDGSACTSLILCSFTL